MARVFFADRFALVMSLFLLSAIGAIGQQPASSQAGVVSSARADDSISIIPGDILDIRVLNLPELDQARVRVTDTGEVPLLLVGPVKIAGLTVGEASAVIADAYMKRNLLRNAHVSVVLEDSSYAFHNVTVFGYVAGATGGANGTNGIIIPISAPRPLLTVLTMAGGLSDRASRTITIQRRDLSVKPFKVSVPNDPDAALGSETMIYPGDTVFVPRAGIVYILGNVGQPHGVVMQENGEISLMEAMSQAGSPLPTAGLSKVMLFRKTDGQYQPIKVDMDKMTKGKTPDIQLQAEDVIWVPFSFGKNLMVNGASIIAALGSATASGVIYTH